ncbi:MAG: SagB/ThcOx family dehydrogenase, partial [Actinobacteria bacterium]|nr:SagB/ThcOx family dehydrogenase [Actinomycetota bacterium]
DALIQRKSSRIFTKRLSLSQIGTLLYYSSGINKNKHFNEPYRFYPSAGARYPLELYIISLRSNLPSGLYHYYVKNHSLEVLLRMEKFDFNKYLLQKAFNKCSVLIIITAVFQRNLMKYGDRGYRYILIEAGHVGQNIYLLSSALNLNCCAVGGFVDDSLNNLLHIDGLHESVLYVFAVG